GCHGERQSRGATHVITVFEAEDRLDPRSEARVRDDQEDPRSADGGTIPGCPVPLHRTYTVPPPPVRCLVTAKKRLFHSCQSESSSRTTTSPCARASGRSSTPIPTSRSWARPLTAS